MEKAVVFLLVSLAVIASAKPYEPARKTSAPDQLSLYPWYERNFLYGTDRIPKEYLDRLFGERVKDSSVDLPPFVHMPDEVPNDLIGNEEEQREEQPIDHEKSPESPKDRIDNEEEQREEQPIDGKPVDDEKDPQEQPKDEKHEKPAADKQSPDAPIDEKESHDGIEEDREKPEQPDQKPKQDDKDKEQQQDGKGEKPNANGETGKDSAKHEKRPKPGHSVIPKSPKKGNRPAREKPSNDLAPRDRPSPQQPGKEARRDGPSQPPPRKPESPLVQINVNVAAPVY